MNFFDQQDRAQRKTTLLVVLLCLAVISLIAIATVAVVAILTFLGPNGADDGTGRADWLAQAAALLDWQLVGTIAALVIAVVVAGSLFKHLQLRAGGRAVAEALDGRLVQPGTTDLEEQKILNVVEEMAIASGIPVPPVYVIEDDAINAFAAGRTHQDAVIGITRGCIRLLTRAELQGVVAHEFSHIFHGDMRLNTRLVAALHGILLIGLIGYFLLRTAPFRRSSSNRDNSAAILLFIGIALVVVGFAGTFFGNLIKAAVSRQREFLADASAVQFTRDPDGIAGALKKIGGAQAGSHLREVHATEYSHMFFGQAVDNAFSTMMATHPPLEERIRRLQPDWQGDFVTPQPVPPEAAPPAEAARERTDRLGMLAASTMAAGDAGADAPARRDAAQAAVLAIGSPGPAHVEYARRALEALDPALREAARDPFSARAMVYGVLLNGSPDIQRAQFAVLEECADPEVLSALRRFRRRLVELDARGRLPLVKLSLPALKQLTPGQYAGFRNCLARLIEADGHVNLTEWAFYRIVVHNLEEPANSFGTAGPAELHDPTALLVSALAHAGHRDKAQAEQAFAAAARLLPYEGIALQPAPGITAVRLDRAVDALARLKPVHKQTLLRALAEAVEHDGIVTVAQAELLRAIADSLDCPLPPLHEAVE